MGASYLWLRCPLHLKSVGIYQGFPQFVAQMKILCTIYLKFHSIQACPSLRIRTFPPLGVVSSSFAPQRQILTLERGFLQWGPRMVHWHGLRCKGLSRKQTSICIKGQQRWLASPPVGAFGKQGGRVSVLLIWCSLGKASIMGDALRIKLPRCKAVACTRSGCRFMLPRKQNEQHKGHLGFGGNEPFHHIDFLKHLKKKKKKALSAAGIWTWLWRICPHLGPLA